MTGELMVLILGCLLLGVGVIGGGIEIKELKIPSLHRGTRFLAAAVGVVLIGFSLSLGHPSFLDPEPSAVARSGGANIAPENFVTAGGPVVLPVAQTTIAPAKQEQTIRFSIVDNLGEGQMMEIVNVTIDGKRVGRLQVDAEHTVASLQIELPAGSDGSHSKTITIEYDAIQSWVGETASTRMYGSEQVTVEDGATYTLYWDLNTGLIYIDQT